MQLALLFVILVFLNLAMSTESPLGQSECGEYDYSRNFPGVRNQDGHGFCWAFAGTALLEEHRCLEDATTCRQMLSVLDESRCTWTMGNDEGANKTGEGNSIAGGIFCGLNEGVCRERLAHYHIKK